MSGIPRVSLTQAELVLPSHGRGHPICGMLVPTVLDIPRDGTIAAYADSPEASTIVRAEGADRKGKISVDSALNHAWRLDRKFSKKPTLRSKIDVIARASQAIRRSSIEVNLDCQDSYFPPSWR